jgi:hypothetical protein
MLDRFHELAQSAATNMSRRQMFGRIGRAAAAAAAVLAGLLPSQAEARGGFCTQCGYLCPDGSGFEISHKGRNCRGEIDGCMLVFQETVRCGSEGPG